MRTGCIAVIHSCMQWCELFHCLLFGWLFVLLLLFVFVCCCCCFLWEVLFAWLVVDVVLFLVVFVRFLLLFFVCLFVRLFVCCFVLLWGCFLFVFCFCLFVFCFCFGGGLFCLSVCFGVCGFLTEGWWYLSFRTTTWTTAHLPLYFYY